MAANPAAFQGQAMAQSAANNPFNQFASVQQSPPDRAALAIAKASTISLYARESSRCHAAPNSPSYA